LLRIFVIGFTLRVPVLLVSELPDLAEVIFGAPAGLLPFGMALAIPRPERPKRRTF
jgi:hypothetical protein